MLSTQMHFLISGCYHRTDLTGAKTFNLHLPSAGLCQEFCMEYNESKKLLFFGVQVLL